ncbi:MAG: TrkH family potassium uptake protein [Phycisphaeraceae bacterium]
MTSNITHTYTRRIVEIPQMRFRPLLLRLLLTGMAAGAIVFEHGFYEPPLPLWIVQAVQTGLLFIYIADLLVRAHLRTQLLPGEELAWTDWALITGAAVGGLLAVTRLFPPGFYLIEFAAGAFFFAELWRLNVALSRLLASPSILLPMSFLLLIGIGTVLLKAPVATPPGEGISWLDALFTITSAVCVTGLVVQNTATAFTPFGQGVILVFIQLGGLGIIIFGSTLALLLGRNLSLRENVSLSEMLADQPLRDTTRFVRFIVLVTLGIELAGALAMYPLWNDPAGEVLTPLQRMGMSLFHSISAFCNAGFDITGQSMVPYRYSLLSQLAVALLIVVGGIGFPVLDNLATVLRVRFHEWRTGRHPTPPRGSTHIAQRRVSLHTKVVLTTSVSLYLFGFVFIGASLAMPQINQYLGRQQQAAAAEPETDLSAGSAGRLLADASFMSITARTAGFHTVPMDDVGQTGRYTLMMLMLVGGSPGSTAGGAKTTVLAMLVLSVLATIRNRRETEAFGRTLADSLVRRAATLGICFLGLVGVATLLLTLSEAAPFETILFEAVSAAATVGLTLGLTDDLTSFGKVVIIVTMFLGRVGPLTLLGALMFARRARRPYAYPHEDVVMG